jgi:acetyl-CoA acetyltransferase
MIVSHFYTIDIIHYGVIYQTLRPSLKVHHESSYQCLCPFALSFRPQRQAGRGASRRPRRAGGERPDAAHRRRSRSLDDVILGCAYPESSQGNNLARIVSLLAGFPHAVSAMTINRFCGSSMSAVHIAAANIEAGLGEAYLCVGVESMTMVPQGGFNFSPHPQLLAETDAYISMGDTAENVARKYEVSRPDQELLALQSHQKAAAAREAGLLKDEIVPSPTTTATSSRKMAASALAPRWKRWPH